MIEHVIIDGKAFDIDGDYRTIRIFAPNLVNEIPYIIDNCIKSVSVETLDPVSLHKWSLDREEKVKFDSNDTVDISHLGKCKHITKLHIEGNILGADVLEELPYLKSLSINNERGKNPVRVDVMRSLEQLWISKYGKNIWGLNECTGLKELQIWNYAPKLRNLEELNKLQKLEKLVLIQPRIDTLDGIESIVSLNSFEVYYSRTLKDISALEKKKISNIVLEHVPKIKPTSKDRVW